jgi:transcriptional regulator with XRE-family HTH domain
MKVSKKAGNGNRPHKTTTARRKRLGQIIKEQRQAQGYTQAQFARLVGQEYFTMISQVEQGVVRVPPHDTDKWALVMGVDTKAFAQECVKAYESLEYYHAIFGPDAEAPFTGKK